MILLELEGISLLRHEDPVESLLEVVIDWPVHPFGDLHESRLPDASRPVYVRRCNCVGMRWNTGTMLCTMRRCAHGADTIRVCETLMLSIGRLIGSLSLQSAMVIPLGGECQWFGMCILAAHTMHNCHVVSRAHKTDNTHIHT